MHQPAETAILQIYPHLLPICPRSVSQTRSDHRNVPDGHKAAQMPSVGRERIRPGTKDIQPMPKKERIRQLFDNIAPEYDRLNHLLSLDIDKTWRRRAVRQIVDTSAPLNILDVACGTGDFAVAIARKAAEGSHITGLDLSEGMLSIGREKILKAGLASVIGLEQGDSEDIPYGEGCFYTQEQMRDIVAFAKERHIEIIPEIDMPGHMVAAIACYPHLSCRGEETEVSVRWGVMDNILCCGKEEVYSFAKDIIDELCEIFPGKYFHIGGDEVPKARWQKCPLCQAKIKEKNLKDVNALQGYFNNVIAEYLKSKGKAMIGWNEILDAHDIMDKNIIAQWWTRRNGDKNEFAWMEKGGKIVISMVNYVYMDHPYNVRPLSKTYSLTAEKLGVMNENNVVGMEIPQWTEYIREVDKLDMLTMARLTAFSEVCWTPAEKRNYNDFEQRLEASREYLDGIKCRICPQAIYSGKTHPRLKFTCASKWNLWRVYPDYEFDEMKKMLVHKDSEK